MMMTSIQFNPNHLRLPIQWQRWTFSIPGGGASPGFFSEASVEHIRLHDVGVSKIGVPQNGWSKMENPMNKWMIWEFSPYFWKHPCLKNSKFQSFQLWIMHCFPWLFWGEKKTSNRITINIHQQFWDRFFLFVAMKVCLESSLLSQDAVPLFQSHRTHGCIVWCRVVDGKFQWFQEMPSKLPKTWSLKSLSFNGSKAVTRSI